MATRRSATRRLPGNSLGGVLRQTARTARSTTRRTVSVPGPQGEQGEAGPPGIPGPVAGLTCIATTLVADDQGVATWLFDGGVDVAVVVATVVTDLPLVATVVALETDLAVLSVLHPDGTPVPGATLMAAAFGMPVALGPSVDLSLLPEPEGS